MILVDAHIHIYPVHDALHLLKTACANMRRIDRTADLVLCLAERRDCFFYSALLEKGLIGAHIVGTDVPEILKLEIEKGISLFLVAGRQIVTSEGVEVLALATTTMFDDRDSLEETLSKVREAGAVGVLPWAPGKWWMKRGKLVYEAIKGADPSGLAVCDQALRFYGWREPAQMRVANERGIRTFAGSDPLPFRADASVAGTYVSSAEITLDASTPGKSILKILHDPTLGWCRVGRRNMVWTAFFRLLGNYAVGTSASDLL